MKTKKSDNKSSVGSEIAKLIASFGNLMKKEHDKHKTTSNENFLPNLLYQGTYEML